MDDVRAFFARRGVFRARSGRLLGGVCAGIGDRLGMDPWIARLLFVLALLAVPGSQLIVYPLLWWLIPLEGSWQPGPSGTSTSHW